MGALLNPVGPEGSRTYWIRRGVVLLVAVVLLWGLVSLFMPKPSAPAAAPAPSPSVAGTSSALTPSASVSATTAPSTVGSVTPSPSVTTPAGPADCDALTVISAIAGFRSVTVGTKQVFSLTLTNNSALTCVLPLSGTSFVVRVSSGADRIWSTGDCPKLIPTKSVTLKAGASYEFKVAWDLTRSLPNCTSAKSALGPGTYVASGTYGETAVGRFVMQLVKK